MPRRPRLFAIEPPDDPLLPVDHVVDELKQRVWNTIRSGARELPIQARKNTRGLDVSVFSRQGSARGLVEHVTIVGQLVPSFAPSVLGEGSESLRSGMDRRKRLAGRSDDHPRRERFWPAPRHDESHL